MPRGGSGWQPSVWHERFLWGALIAVVILTFGLLTAAVCNAADLPHYADLTFIDMADLDAQVDSVLAVCDTTYSIREHKLIHESACEHATHNDCWQISVAYGSCVVITCRRWAGLTIKWMPNEPRPGTWANMPSKGKARLWWWETKEE